MKYWMFLQDNRAPANLVWNQDGGQEYCEELGQTWTPIWWPPGPD